MTGGMMFKGTPGPWRVVEKMGFDGIDGNGETGEETNLMGIVGGDGSRVLWIGDCSNYYPTEGDEPSTEDSNLIAAAPELLEAASMALSVMEVEYITNNRTDLAQFMEPLRAAIAKALGEQK